MEHAADPLHVADPGWLVEAQLVAEGVQRFWRRTRAQNDRGDVPRQDVRHREHQDRGRDQAHDEPGHANQDLDAHRVEVSNAGRVSGEVGLGQVERWRDALDLIGLEAFFENAEVARRADPQVRRVVGELLLDGLVQRGALG